MYPFVRSCKPGRTAKGATNEINRLVTPLQKFIFDFSLIAMKNCPIAAAIIAKNTIMDGMYGIRRVKVPNLQASSLPSILVTLQDFTEWNMNSRLFPKSLL